MSLLNWPNFTASVEPQTEGADAEIGALSPERALLSPVWIASLAILGLNDHLFKGSGLLPDVLTGKLSDVAGMLVAPALLAAVTRTKSRRGLFLCHLAVGAVFAAINLSGDAAAAWSALMGLVGAPWTITVDPTDLIVLPALFLSWKALAPDMTKPVPRGRVRAIEGTLAGVGVCLSVATSSDEPWEGEEGWWTNPINADVYVQNTSDVSTVVRLRSPREGVMLDCFELAANPGILSEEIFGEAVSYTLAPGNVVAARDTGVTQGQACYAVLVEGDTFPQTLVFWENGDIPVEWIDGDRALEGGLILEWEDDHHTIEAMKRPELIQPLADRDDPPAGACTPQEDGGRLAWTQPPSGERRVAALDVGPDGCIAVDFSSGEPDGLTDWYVCAPPELFPFVVGDWIRSETINEALITRRVIGPDQEPVVSAELFLSTGSALPPLIDTTLSLRADFDCSLAPDECGSVSRNASLTAQRGDLPVASIAVGETAHLDLPGSDLAIHLVHAQERVLVNTECSEGPGATGDDIEVVAVYTDPQ